MRFSILLTTVIALVCMTAPAEMQVSAGGLVGRSKPCSAEIQRLINENPNREIYFPDGTYLLDQPICTPADPKRSVSLRLSNYARFVAVKSWTNREAMVRLGAIHAANDIDTPGSWYWLKGGIIDGSGVANGVSIDGGRETLVADVSMKNVHVGLRIKFGANSGSSDADVRNVNIVGNGAVDSIGVLIEGFDNTLQNMRIANVMRGLVIYGGGTSLRDIHPLFVGDWKYYDQSIGFDIYAKDVFGDYCYSDQFATGFRFNKGAGGVFEKSFCFWYRSAKEMKHVAFESVETFDAQMNNPTIWFKEAKAQNALLKVGKAGGQGFLRDPRFNTEFVNDPKSVHNDYLRRTR